MVKKSLLFLIPPHGLFYNDQIESSVHRLKGVENGPTIVRSDIDPNKCETTFIDYDAHFLKRYYNERRRLTIKELTYDMIPNANFDYIFISMSYIHTIITDYAMIFIHNYIREVSQRYPNTTFVVGGNAFRFLRIFDDYGLQLRHNMIVDKSYLEDFAKLKLKLKLPDLLGPNECWPDNVISYQQDVGATGSLPKSIWKDIGLTDGNRFNIETENDIKFSLITGSPTKTLDNINDVKHSYRYILEVLNLPTEGIPEEYLNKTLQGIHMSFAIGCPNQCYFCASSSTKYQQLTHAEIIDHVQRNIDLGFNIFDIYDNLSNLYADKFCNWLISKNKKILWKSSFSLSEDSKEFYQMLYESGCRMMDSGFESINQNRLNEIGKPAAKDKILQNIEWAHESGLMFNLNFIVNFPYETKSEFAGLLKFMRENINKVFLYDINQLTIKGNSVLNQKMKEMKISSWYDGQPHSNYYETSGIFANDPIAQYKLFIEKWKILCKFVTDNGIKKIHQGPPPYLVFALYDIFQLKSLVENFINEYYYPQVTLDFSYYNDLIKKHLTKLTGSV